MPQFLRSRHLTVNLSRLLVQCIASNNLSQHQGTVSINMAAPLSLSRALSLVLSLIFYGSDWLMAPGQSKLLRPALYLAVNALSPFSFPSLSPSCSLLPLLPQHSAHLGREWTGWEGAAAARGGGGSRKGKITRRQMRFVEMDRNVERMSVGKWEKRAMEH